jgi:outer membrane immunogenic protein
MSRKFLISVAFGTISHMAVAADMPIIKGPEPFVAPAPAFTWTGLYVGGSAGYGWASYNHTFNTVGHFNSAANQTLNYRGEGFVGGLSMGFNYQISSLVLGVEASATGGALGSGTKISPFFPASDRWSSTMSWVGSIAPRVGVAFDRAHVFLKGGVAFTSVRDRAQDTQDFFDVRSSRTGYNVGVGLEYAFAANWIFGVEYNNYNFGSQNVTSPITALPGQVAHAGAVPTNHNLRTNMNTAMINLKYKF